MTATLTPRLRLSPTDENALVACDVAVEAAESRATEAEGLAQRYLLEREQADQTALELQTELLQRVEAEVEARCGREEATEVEVQGLEASPGIKAGRAISKQRPASRPRASVESAGSGSSKQQQQQQQQGQQPAAGAAGTPGACCAPCIASS